MINISQNKDELFILRRFGVYEPKAVLAPVVGPELVSHFLGAVYVDDNGAEHYQATMIEVTTYLVNPTFSDIIYIMLCWAH